MNEFTNLQTVDPNKAQLKRSTSGIFLILCTFPILAILAVIPTYIYAIFVSLFDFSAETLSILSYIFTFAIPQILYPLFTLIAAFFMVSFSGKSKKEVVKYKDVPESDTFLCIGIFLGMGTIGTYLSDFITRLIIALGVPVPDISEYLAAPNDMLQFCLYLISIAIMPAICEELIFRGIICGILSDFNKTAAIIFSSIAFSFVHSTVQQIPFSFIMGLFLAYIYIRYKSIIPCILLHFINNLLSCIFMLLYDSISEAAYMTIVNIYDITTVVVGIICGIVFVLLRKKEKATEKDNYVPKVSGKTFTISTVFSIPFILFVLIFLFQTVTGILSYYYQ